MRTRRNKSTTQTLKRLHNRSHILRLFQKLSSGRVGLQFLISAPSAWTRHNIFCTPNLDFLVPPHPGLFMFQVAPPYLEKNALKPTTTRGQLLEQPLQTINTKPSMACLVQLYKYTKKTAVC